MMEYIFSNDVPKPAGHYAHGVKSGNLIFISGQLPGGLEPTASLEEQVMLCLQRIKLIAEAGGSNLQSIVKTTLFITNAADWPEVNKIYAAFFGAHTPARSIVPVKELHYGYKVEIEAVAEIS
jgi:2-iminobutanoate/2-iminopropanoate deaminase